MRKVQNPSGDILKYLNKSFSQNIICMEIVSQNLIKQYRVSIIIK
jgi:hypothetical protein